MALTVTGKSTHVGQIVKVLDSESGDTSITGPEFELFHKKELTVAVFNKGSAAISDIKLMRILHDGTASQESISSSSVTTGNGVTFAVSYNIPSRRRLLMTQTIIHVPASEGGGSFDPTDIEITDGIDDAFLIKDTGGNEWFKIDTRNGTGENCINMAYGAGQKVLIGIANSTSQGPFSPFQVTNSQNSSYAVRIYGGTSYAVDNQLAWGRDNQKTVWVHPLGGRFDSSSSSGVFDFRDSSDLAMLSMDDNTNTTFTLNDGNSALFKIQDDAGSPHEFFKVDTTASARDIRMKTGASNQIFTMQEGTGTGKFFQIRNGAYNQIYMQSDNLFGILAEQLTHTMYANGFFRGVSSDGGDVFKFTDDSNITFTLDSGSTCNFKVVDDAGSPTTYIDVERGSTEKVKIPIIGLETIRTASGGGVFIASLSSTTGMSMNNFPINYSNTLLTFDQTADGTTSAQSIKPGLTVVYSSSASGAATSSGITLQLGAGVPADGTTSPQYLVMHNQNSTHSAKFILDGSGFYSGHEVATSGSDAADLIGSGFTLAAGKFAVFSIIACRVTNTGDHYFYAVSLHTKT